MMTSPRSRRMGEMRNAYKFVDVEPEGKRPRRNWSILLKWILKK
jgi:hypothetical protein